MEDSHSPSISITLEDQFATANPPQAHCFSFLRFVHPNTQNRSESIPTINMEMVNTDCHSNIHNTFAGETHSHIATVEETMPPFPIPARFQIYTGMLYLVYAAALLYMFPSLIALVGIKFQNKANSPFETDSLFANLAVIAYIIAIPMPIALFCLKVRFAMKSHPPICLWSLLPPLSFVLVLFLPHGLGLIGYLIIFILLVVVVVCSFSNDICKKDASDLEAHTSNEIWSHSTLTITEE